MLSLTVVDLFQSIVIRATKLTSTTHCASLTCASKRAQQLSSWAAIASSEQTAVAKESEIQVRHGSHRRRERLFVDRIKLKCIRLDDSLPLRQQGSSLSTFKLRNDWVTNPWVVKSAPRLVATCS